MFLFAIAVAGIAVAAPADPPAEYTASKFVADCGAGSSDYRTGVCIGYVEALVAAEPLLAVLKAYWKKVPIDDTRTRHYCLPEGVTKGQAIQVAVKYIEAHPEKWHTPALYLIRDSWAAAFPC